MGRRRPGRGSRRGPARETGWRRRVSRRRRRRGGCRTARGTAGRCLCSRRRGGCRRSRPRRPARRPDRNRPRAPGTSSVERTRGDRDSRPSRSSARSCQGGSETASCSTLGWSWR
jgi:hypothetical protein